MTSEPIPKSFHIPSIVESEVICNGQSYPGYIGIQSISTEKLSKMCDEFRAKIFEKAGKKDPKIK